MYMCIQEHAVWVKKTSTLLPYPTLPYPTLLNIDI